MARARRYNRPWDRGDYAPTHDPAFFTADGRSTFALSTRPRWQDEAANKMGPAMSDRAVTAGRRLAGTSGRHRMFSSYWPTGGSRPRPRAQR